jgi:hypothetical protein
MRWSSVWLVFSLCAYQPSLVALLRFGMGGLLVMAGVGGGVAVLRCRATGEKKPPGLPAVSLGLARCVCLCAGLSNRRAV